MKLIFPPLPPHIGIQIFLSCMYNNKDTMGILHGSEINIYNDEIVVMSLCQENIVKPVMLVSCIFNNICSVIKDLLLCVQQYL